MTMVDEPVGIELVRRPPMLACNCETQEDRIHYVVQLMAMGEFKRHKTAVELSRTWRLSRIAASRIITEAYRMARVVVNPTKLLTTIDQATDELLEIAYYAKESGMAGDSDALKAAIVAFGKVTDVSLALLKGREEEVEGKWPDTAQKLIAAGWTPPVLEGLPFPNVDDPDKEPSE
jgi:hypothetical protein